MRLAAVAISALLTLPLLGTAQRIPSRLSDATFWRLVRNLSEDGGQFESDNFVSNEGDFQYVIPQLRAGFKAGGAYIGVGPEQNFAYIVAVKPSIAFVCDVRRENMLEHLMYKALIELSDDRADFLSRLWSRPRPPSAYAASGAKSLADAFASVTGDSRLFLRNLAAILHQLSGVHRFPIDANDSASIRHVYAAFFHEGPNLTYSYGRLTDRFRGVAAGVPTFAELMAADDGMGVNQGWLGNEAEFLALKDFETRNLLVPIVGDFAGPTALRGVGAYLRANHTRLGVFYVSNVEQYLFGQGDAWVRFYASVATLPTDSTSMFVRAVANSRTFQPRNPVSRMAQTVSPINVVLREFQAGRIMHYSDIAEARRE